MQTLLISISTAACVLQVPAPTMDIAEEATAEDGEPKSSEQAPPAPRQEEHALVQDADEVHPAIPSTNACMAHCLSRPCQDVCLQLEHRFCGAAKPKLSVPGFTAAEQIVGGAV